MLNERYDESNRWCGNINFAGHIFPNMRNFTSNHKATSIGNQLLSNYKKFLYAYEKCYASRDLQRMPCEEVRGTTFRSPPSPVCEDLATACLLLQSTAWPF